MSAIETVSTPGLNLYVVIHQGGQVWNTNSLTFENYNSAHWLQYATSLSEQSGSGYYSAAYPSQIAAGGLSTEIIYQRIDSNPTLGDPPLSIGQSQGVNVQALNAAGSAAIKMQTAVDTEVRGTATSSTLSTTQMSSDVSNALANAYLGRTILWTSGTLSGCAASILGYATTNGVFTFTPVPAAPGAGDSFILV